MLELRLKNTHEDLVDSARRIVKSGMPAARLIFPGVPRVDPAAVDAIASILAQASALQLVVLVHPGAAVRFLASALTLRLPRIAFEVDARSGDASAPASRRTATLSTADAYTVHVRASADVPAAVAQALAPARDWYVRGMVVVLDPRIDVVRSSFAHALARELESIQGLERVALVHPGLAANTATTIATRVTTLCPRLRVWVSESETAAIEMLRASGKPEPAAV